jgi:uncharacterized protein (TIGR03435 family)
MEMEEAASAPRMFALNPTKLSRRVAARLFAAAALMPSSALVPQQAAAPQQAATPEFDVASVKPSREGGWQGIDTSPGRIRANSTTLGRCIRQAYDLGPHQLLGGPAWIDTDRWEIVARAESAIDNDDVLMLMLRRLLADRFQLAVHRETRDQPAYILEVNKSGPKLQRAEPGDADTEMHGGRGGPATLEASRTDMNRLAELLSSRMDRQVVNHTGLTGGFNFTLHSEPDNARMNDDSAEDVSIFTAIGAQLGLRLRPAKAPLDVLVIDHVERPSAN